MNKNDYIKDALRTESIDGLVERTKLGTYSLAMLNDDGLLNFLSNREVGVDALKRFIAYNTKSKICEKTELSPSNLVVSEEQARLVHAGLGMLTEAGEFMEAVIESIFLSKEIDKVNLKEEIGDSQWYQAIACDVLDTTFEEVQTININKLKARFPDKFSQDKAENRDLNKERKTLEEK